jgi:hypothetical protein
MPKFKLICDHSCALDTHVVTHEFNAEYLPDVLANIRMFLQGAGFVIDGVIDIIPNDEYYGLDPEFGDHGGGSTPDMYDEIDVVSTKSHHYFDTERNR